MSREQRTPMRAGQRVFENTDAYRRSWLTLQDPLTGATLELDPGQRVSLDLPADFSDAFLQEVPPKAPKASKSPAATPDEPKEA